MSARDEPLEPLDRPNSGPNGVGGHRHVIAYLGDYPIGCCRWRLEHAVIPAAATGGDAGGGSPGAGGGSPAVVAVITRLLVNPSHRRKGHGAALLVETTPDVFSIRLGR